MTEQTNSEDTGVAVEELISYMERIERLEEEKTDIAGDIKEVYAELKGRGFDAKAVRRLLKYKKMDAAERQEDEAIFELYGKATGIVT